MGVHIFSVGIVAPERWERTNPDNPDCTTVQDGDTRFALKPRFGGCMWD